MITGDGRPSNTTANQLDLNNGGWTFIAILIGIILILIIIILIIHFKNKTTISKLREFSKNEITDEERDLLLKYRQLNIRDKNVINDTLLSLSENHQNETLTKG